MKYLVTALPGTTPIPPEQLADLYRAATAWIEAGLEEGRFECVYVFADAGGIAIGNADSHEAVFDTLLTYPLYPFFRWEVKPLCDWGHIFKTIVEGATRSAALLRGGG